MLMCVETLRPEMTIPIQRRCRSASAYLGILPEPKIEELCAAIVSRLCAVMVDRETSAVVGRRVVAVHTTHCIQPDVRADTENSNLAFAICHSREMTAQRTVTIEDIHRVETTVAMQECLFLERLTWGVERAVPPQPPKLQPQLASCYLYTRHVIMRSNAFR